MTHPPTRPLTHPPTRPLTHPPTRPLTHPATRAATRPSSRAAVRPRRGRPGRPAVLRRVAALAGAVLLALAGTVATAPLGAHAIDHSKGSPGFCKSSTGVTVVVDFQQLGGTTIVRCNPRGSRGTGLDALKGAGFQIAGVQRWGEAFICRIENRPSAVEKLPIKGNEGYRELCIDTPPAAGYWSYWHAGNNCAWTYSQWGVKNRDFIPGGFEGWSFSLNATADTNPRPRIAAVRPGTSGRPCTARKEPKPTSNNPNVKQPGSSGGTGGADGGGTGPGSGTGTDGDGDGERDGGGRPDGAQVPGTGQGPTGRQGALPPPKPRAGTADDPGKNVAFTGGENAPDVNQVIKKQSGASDYAPWAALAAAILLALATWVTALRRRRARHW
ncbi:ABC transporter substrate-binding protein [Actinomadura syzygii]|uniref:ABC transporter substrate-binding protein n=1 Tax=Actinomadura syzygii TaxID=1427538 RepID=UPI0036202C78